MELLFPSLIPIKPLKLHRPRRTQHWPQRRVPSYARDAILPSRQHTSTAILLNLKSAKWVLHSLRRLLL